MGSWALTRTLAFPPCKFKVGLELSWDSRTLVSKVRLAFPCADTLFEAVVLISYALPNKQCKEYNSMCSKNRNEIHFRLEFIYISLPLVLRFEVEVGTKLDRIGAHGVVGYVAGVTCRGPEGLGCKEVAPDVGVPFLLSQVDLMCSTSLHFLHLIMIPTLETLLGFGFSWGSLFLSFLDLLCILTYPHAFRIGSSYSSQF